MPIRQLNPSLTTAANAHAKPEDVTYELSASARRNSVVDFAAEYSLQRQNSAASPLKSPPKLVKRNSILTAAGDKDHLSEVRNGLAGMNFGFDGITDMAETHHKGVVGKYKVTDEGDILLLSKVTDVGCAASEAIDMLWDHRESTVTKIAGDIIAHCDIKTTVNSNQRILWLRYKKPTMGVAGNTSARDASVLADKSAASSDLPMITFSSVTTALIPPHENYVRGDTKVLGFVVEPIEARKCSIFFACDFAMHGGFGHPLSKCLLKCTGFDKMAARNCSVDCNNALARLKGILEARAAKKTALVIADE